jgi:hypothetical protein
VVGDSCGSFDYHGEKEGTMVVGDSCDVKGVLAELMFNCSSPRYTEVRGWCGFKMVR